MLPVDANVVLVAATNGPASVRLEAATSGEAVRVSRFAPAPPAVTWLRSGLVPVSCIRGALAVLTT